MENELNNNIPIHTIESEDDLQIQHQRSWDFFVIFFCVTIIFIIGLMGNSILIYIIPKYFNSNGNANINQESYVQNIIFWNLAIIDFGFLLTSPFTLTIQSLNNYWIFGTTICKIYIGLYVLKPTMSALILLFLAIDNLKFRGKELPNQHCIIVITVLWIFSLGWTIPLMEKAQLKGFDKIDEKQQCVCLDEPGGFVVYLIISYSFPIILMIFTLFLILFLKCDVLSKNTLKLTLILICCHIIAWMPAITGKVAFMWFNLVLGQRWGLEFSNIQHLLIFTISIVVNSAIDPITVVFFRQDLRNYLGDFLGIKKLQDESTKNENDIFESGELPAQQDNARIIITTEV